MTGTRKPIFDAIKAARGKGFDTLEVGAIDNVLDALGVPRDGVTAFDTCLAEILRHEGGYSNHPSDPGGRTMLGVTQRVWEQWTGKPADEATMRALTPETVAPLYRKNYWEAVGADDLPPALALCVFDFAVNAGPGRAIRYLQHVVGAASDGRLGPVTKTLTNRAVEREGAAALVRKYQDERRHYYRSLSNFDAFGRGWLRRVDAVEAKALEMAQ